MVKEFQRPSEKKTAKVVANTTAIQPVIDLELDKKFVKFDEVQSNERGHNFTGKKIVPVKATLADVLSGKANKGDEVMRFRVEDLSYISLAVHPKELENSIINLAPRKCIKSVRVYTQGKDPYIFAALDRNLIFKKKEQEDLISTFDLSLQSRVDLDLLKGSIIKTLITNQHGFDLIMKDDELGIMLDVNRCISYLTTTYIHEDRPKGVEGDVASLARAIQAQVVLSKVEFAGGKLLFAYTFENKLNSKLIFATASKNIVAANVSMLLSKFQEKAKSYLTKNIDYNARLEYVTTASLLVSMYGTNYRNSAEYVANKEKGTHLNALLANDAVYTTQSRGQLNVATAPLVVLDGAYKAPKPEYSTEFLKIHLKDIPAKEDIKYNLVLTQLGNMLTGEIVAFGFAENEIAVVPDIKKLVMLVELGDVRPDFKIGVLTNDKYISYNLSM